VPHLDLANFYFFSCLVELTLGIGVLALWCRAKIPSLVLWASGFFCSTLGYLLISQRHELPDWISVITGNSALSLSSVMLYLGSCIFIGARRSLAPFVFLLLEAVLLSYFTYIHYDTNIRVYIHSLSQSLITSVHILLLLKTMHVKGNPGRVDAIIPLSFFVLFMLLRAIGSSIFPSPQDFLAAGNFQVLFSLGGLVAHIGSALAFANMHSAALHAKLNARTAELEEANRQLEVMSMTDFLTGLPNRRKFDMVMEAEWQRAMRQGRRLALIMLDIDQFKAYNDHYGHQSGDLCLQRVARALQVKVHRAGELVARYGGEEFVVILPELDAAQACAVGERIRHEVEAQQIAHATNAAATPVVTVSIGVALCYPQREGQLNCLLQEADASLYEAKHRGRNRVVMLQA